MVNAHDKPRGLYLFDWLGSRRPRTTDKKKSPTFFMPASQRKSEKCIASGTWAKEKTNSKGAIRRTRKKTKTTITRNNRDYFFY